MLLACQGQALEWAQRVLASRGLPVPLHLQIMADNTCRESRNQWLFLWCSEQIANGRFKSISCPFFRVGHTHFVVDRRFSTVAKILSKAQCLQTPQAGFLWACFFLQLAALFVV